MQESAAFVRARRTRPPAAADRREEGLRRQLSRLEREVREAAVRKAAMARTGGEPFGAIHARMLETFADCAATVVKTEHHHQVLERVRKTA